MLVRSFFIVCLSGVLLLTLRALSSNTHLELQWFLRSSCSCIWKSERRSLYLCAGCGSRCHGKNPAYSLLGVQVCTDNFHFRPFSCGSALFFLFHVQCIFCLQIKYPHFLCCICFQFLCSIYLKLMPALLASSFNVLCFQLRHHWFSGVGSEMCGTIYKSIRFHIIHSMTRAFQASEMCKLLCQFLKINGLSMEEKDLADFRFVLSSTFSFSIWGVLSALHGKKCTCLLNGLEMVWSMPWSLQGGNIVQGLKNADGTDKTECGIHIEYNIWSHRRSSSKSSLVCKAVQSKAYTICMRNVVLKCPSNKLHPFFCSTASTGCTIFAMRSSHFSPYLKLVNCTVCPAILLPKCLHTCSDHCSH